MSPSPIQATCCAILIASTLRAADEWKQHVGEPGPTGWRCHVIQPDPQDHGPDGINIHDWNGDGLPDVFVNYEEGRYSRLYFHPGDKDLRDPWTDYLEFKHGKCEDSGIGDLDNDGDIDYVANGGWVYFNPGKDRIRDLTAWKRMTLFDHERRVPTVADVDGDGLNDLIVGAQEWYRQPKTKKHDAASWTRYTIGKNRWPMNCILSDMNADGHPDMVVPDRGVEICWYQNPGRSAATGPWQRNQLHDHTEPMFVCVSDLNGDGRLDCAITGGSKGKHARKLIVLLRTHDDSSPEYTEILLDQPSGNFPKGIAAFDLDGNPENRELLIIPKQGDLWMASFKGSAFKRENWKTSPIRMPGAETRKKMDNAWIHDLDGDGDLDVLTTEENGGWGVIWFENPGH